MTGGLSLRATTKNRYSGTTIQRYRNRNLEPEPGTVHNLCKLEHFVPNLRSTHGHGLLIGLHRNTIQRCDGEKLLIIFIHVVMLIIFIQTRLIRFP
jgi:hypothetical protein